MCNGEPKWKKGQETPKCKKCGDDIPELCLICATIGGIPIDICPECDPGCLDLCPTINDVAEYGTSGDIVKAKIVTAEFRKVWTNPSQRCECGEEPCGYTCDSQVQSFICEECCSDIRTCPIKCPICGGISFPEFPLDYTDRRLLNSCGPETPGFCKACGSFD